jgi:hypothetical protein
MLAALIVSEKKAVRGIGIFTNMEFNQTIVKPRRKFNLYENYISINRTHFFGDHTEVNIEYRAITTTISTSTIRRESFSNYLGVAVLILIFGIVFFLDENQTSIITLVVMGSVFMATLAMAFRVRKRVIHSIFHNHEGVILLDIPQEADESKQFISEFRKRISSSQSKNDENP